MLGVYLTAAELTRRGLIVSITSRSALGADILATDERCRVAWSIQVKTNKRATKFWLMNRHVNEIKADSHIYVFVNLRGEARPDFYVVPSTYVAKKAVVGESSTGSRWYSFYRDDLFKDAWSTLGLPNDPIS
jgi:hypothetical protein